MMPELLPDIIGTEEGSVPSHPCTFGGPFAERQSIKRYPIHAPISSCATLVAFTDRAKCVRVFFVSCSRSLCIRACSQLQLLNGPVPASLKSVLVDARCPALSTAKHDAQRERSVQKTHTP